MDAMSSSQRSDAGPADTVVPAGTHLVPPTVPAGLGAAVLRRDWCATQLEPLPDGGRVMAAPAWPAGVVLIVAGVSSRTRAMAPQARARG